jgi:hypothetical protein
VPTVFPFEFEASYRLPARLFLVTPETARVVLTDADFDAGFGRWRVRTPLSNISGVHITGPYGFLKTAGPAHLSLSDRGLTLATNRRQGLCVRFREPVAGIEPTGRIRHPSLTVTVADCPGLQHALEDVMG